MANGNFGQCSGCGARVVWVKTEAGKNMPCDPAFRNYKIDPSGKDKIVTPAGKVVTGIIDVDPSEADGYGYISHFATCRRASNFRRGRK